MNALQYAAAAFCVAAHQSVGQKRKYNGEPYYTHPFAVAKILGEYVSGDAMLCAAYLHDTVEDTGVSIDNIETVFGEEVALLVLGLTNVSKHSDGNRAVRKAMDRNHTWDQSDKVQIIKCADVIHNMSDLVGTDFGKKYAREKLLLLEGMRIKDHPIWLRALDLCKSI